MSALFMIFGGVVMLTVQLAAEHFGSKDAHSLSNATLAISVCAIVGGLLWWMTKQSIWMLLGCVILQVGACLFYFVGNSVLPEVFLKLGFTMGMRSTMFISGSPLLLALAAWNNYRSYREIISTEKRRR